MVTQARLAGKRSNDPKLQLDIQRAFQGNRLELVTNIGKIKADLAITKRDLELEATKAQELQKAFVGERTTRLRSKAWISFAWKAVAAVLWSGGCIATGIWLALNSHSGNSVMRTIGLPGLLISMGVLTAPAALWRVARQFRTSLGSVRERAEDEVASISDTSKSKGTNSM